MEGRGKMTNENIGNLLSKISLEGRAEAIYQLMLKTHIGSEISKAYAAEAVKYFEGREKHEQAALVAELTGMDEEAAINYKKAQKLEKAETIAEKLIKGCEREQLFYRAAAFAEKMEMYDEASHNYEKAGRFKEAAEAAKKGGLLERQDLYARLANLTVRIL